MSLNRVMIAIKNKFISLFCWTDPPTASLKLGTSLNASNIKEGDDVYFECSVNSNPRPNKIIWKKDVSMDNPLKIVLLK